MDGGDLIGVSAIVQSNSEVEQNEQTIMNRQWLDENGFESRVKGRGFLIRGVGNTSSDPIAPSRRFFLTPCCVCSFFFLRKVEVDFLKCHLYLCLCIINQIAIKLLTFL
ncbi:hypothetical protein HanXRQr2_Chr03g0093911 [Helianthus annuus]|uniref:Uncharacterized protein n=1 Tax=Helianthus annuus TaxID=4232 RepID=A0A9K3NUF0_HELAN|nr:hypothetical protein HanXRQr2_Chr03g0093911 [Helianthus annuus]